MGHAGTLDRFASGVLIALVGAYTRRCEEVMSWPKTYEATVKLGATTPTDDPDSPETPQTLSGSPLRLEVEEALKHFSGLIQQKPPQYSALKVNGSRASDRVRQGNTIELPPRLVQVHRIEMLNYEWPLLQVRIDCGRGTYIRSIARDLGEKLGTGGYLTALRRTRIGDYGIDQAVKLENLTRENVQSHLRVIKTA